MPIKSLLAFKTWPLTGTGCVVVAVNHYNNHTSKWWIPITFSGSEKQILHSDGWVQLYVRLAQSTPTPHTAWAPWQWVLSTCVVVENEWFIHCFHVWCGIRVKVIGMVARLSLTRFLKLQWWSKSHSRSSTRFTIDTVMTKESFLVHKQIFHRYVYQIIPS